MDLITSSLLIGGVWVVYEGGNLIYNTVYRKVTDWGKTVESLVLDKYRAVRKLNTKYGYILTIEIDPGGSFEELTKEKGKMEKIFKGKVFYKDIPFTNLCEIEVINKYPGDIKYTPMDLPPTQLLIGYDFRGEPIVIDMLITAHLGVSGLSNNGKSKCIELALTNLKGADIHLVNCMAKDYKNIEAIRINGNDEIMDYLKKMSEETEVRERPLYIVIDEYNVLSRLKGVDKAIQDLLSQARHRNVYCVVLMQLGQKEDCKFKNLFNCRLAFRSIEESSLRAFIGCSIEDTTLQQREFYLLHTELIRGKTYLL